MPTYTEIYAESYGGVLIGTSLDERLIGSKFFDLIYGGSEPAPVPNVNRYYGDEINGYGGDDWLNGDRGEDVIYGGKGDDEIYGGRKNITYTTSDGDDILYGNGGRDKIYGGTGDDEIYGGNDNDRLYGGEDNDYLDGGADDDYLAGEDGDDWLRGRFGSDILEGGAGDDTLTGGGGLDWYVFDSISDQTDRITNFTRGTDKIVLNYDNFTSLTLGTALSSPGHPLANSVFFPPADFNFYPLASSDYERVDILTNATGTTEIVVVEQAEPPAGGITSFPAVYYYDGANYELLAVLTNGVLPRATDFIIYDPI